MDRNERYIDAPRTTSRPWRTDKVRDYSTLIDKLTARIESLERTRAELAKTSPPEDAPVGRIEIEIVGGN